MWSVKFEGVTKRYRSDGVRYRSIRSDIASAARRASGRKPTGGTGHYIDAIDDLDMELEQGHSYAIVGRNGAGKSTALRLISRITYPTAGKVSVRGRVGALIEIGAGVHPELSGRENIWLYGSFLGLRRSDIRARLDDIVDFSELSRQIDQQVKYYSTGMKLRLGFSIASFLEPDVFIVDESLAVGDGSFQAKCIGRMHQLGTEGRHHHLRLSRDRPHRGALHPGDSGSTRDASRPTVRSTTFSRRTTGRSRPTRRSGPTAARPCRSCEPPATTPAATRSHRSVRTSR